MKSLIISDIHDNVKNLQSALTIANTTFCTSVICCGDLCSPFIIDTIDKNCKVPFHLIFGNNDGDKHTIISNINFANTIRNEDSKIIAHGEFILAERNHKIAGVPSSVSFAAYHYPQMAQVIARSSIFDFVFFGHTHHAHLQNFDSTTFANPGSVLGYTPGGEGKFVAPTCLIVNWETKEIELIEF